MSAAIAQLVKAQTNNAADGTGITKLIGLTKNFLHITDSHDIPQFLIDYVQDQQQSQFGGYPSHKDVAPSAVFLAVFVVIAIAHGTLFAVNWKRGHKFLLSALLALYATMRWIGFALRIVWAKDILRLHVGIASEVLLVLPIVFLASFNLVLAQRLFTWRHPIIGNHKWFWYLMIFLYAVVTAVVVMTIVAGVIPYLYFLSRSHYDMCRNVVKVTSILISLYSLASMALVALSFVVKTTQSEKESLVYQPFWIKSFSPLYFTPVNASKEGEAAFVATHIEDSRPALRTIVGGCSTFIDGQDESEAQELAEYENAGESKFSAKHNISIIIIAITSVFVFLGAIFRCVACFIDDVVATQSWIYKPVVMYVLWGALETIVNVLYLVGRIDLRFYRPDALKGTKFTDKTRITADLSPEPTTNPNKENNSSISHHSSDVTRV